MSEARAEAHTATVLPDSVRLFVAQVLGNAGFFVAVLLVARVLGPSGRGTVAFVTVLCLVLARIASLGVQEASTYLAAREEDGRGSILVNLWLWTLLSASAVAALTVGGMEALGLTPGFLGPTEQVVLGVGTVVAGFVDAGIAYLYGIKAFRSVAPVTATAPWIYVALLAVAAFVGDVSPGVALGCWLVTHVAWAGALVVACVRNVRPGRPRAALFRSSLHYGIRAWVGTMARFANFRADQLLLGLLASEAVLGIYAVSVNASEMLLYLPAAVASVLVSQVATVHPDHQPLEIKRAFRIVAVLTVAATALAVLAGPVLIPVVFGSAYGGSVEPFVILSIGALGYAASAIFSGGLLGASRPGLSSVGPLTSLVLGVVLDVTLIPPFGASGAAVAATVAFAGGGIAAAVLFRRAFGLSARELLPTLEDARTATAKARRLLAVRGRGLSMPSTAEDFSSGPLGRLSLRSGPYYVARASFERVRLVTSRTDDSGAPCVRILAYHRVSDDRDYLAVRPSVFRRQLEVVLERGYVPIALDRAVELIGRRRGFEGRYVCVTFDDGYLDNAEVALPHLEELRIPATIFLPTAVIDGEADYHWYDNPPPAMTWADVRAVEAGGLVSFEPHGTTHRAMPSLPPDVVREEMVESRRAIESELGRPASIFCFPAGLYGPRETRIAREIGYRAAVTTMPGANGPGDDLFELRRTVIAWSDTPRTFALKLDGAIDQLSPIERWVRARRVVNA